MQINSVGTSSNLYNNKQAKNHKKTNTNFKGLMDIPGALMQGLENTGFIGSFLVQDTLGMTVPRTREGLYRDVPEEKKKNFKDLNFKEGAEVLIREALSGPLMMFTPVAVLLLGKKFIGKSTFTNSAMIKRLGHTLTETVKGGKHASTKELKADFYRRNITKMVQNTTNAADKTAEAAFIDNTVNSVNRLDEIAEQLKDKSLTRKVKKALKKEQVQTESNIVNMFNDFHQTHNNDFAMVNKVKFDKDGTFSTQKSIQGMRDYIADATNGKNVADITEETSNKLQKKSLITRGIVNALAAASTIGSVSIVPMLYKLVNPVPPGSLNNTQSAGQNKNQVTTEPKIQPENKTTNKDGKVSFTGKWDSLARHFEFNGNQLTPALMTTLAAGGLIAPRVNTAIKRAPEDPVTKKKDYSEVPEVLTRDIVSTGAVTFGVPMLSKAIVSSYEGASGFVLQNRPEKPMSTFKKVLDKMNPFSSYAPYSLSDLGGIYGDLNTTKKLNTFSQFVDNNNGSLAKVFNTVEGSKEIFNEHGLDLKELAKQKDRKAANKTIMDAMQNSEFTDKLLAAIKPKKAGSANNILKRARSLNSITTAVTTLLLVPAFLGIVLPKAVYGLTAKRRQKQLATDQSIEQAIEQANAQQNNSQPVATPQIQQTTTADATQKIDYTKLKQVDNSKTFGQLKHS